MSTFKNHLLVVIHALALAGVLALVVPQTAQAQSSGAEPGQGASAGAESLGAATGVNPLAVSPTAYFQTYLNRVLNRQVPMRFGGSLGYARNGYTNYPVNLFGRLFPRAGEAGFAFGGTIINDGPYVFGTQNKDLATPVLPSVNSIDVVLQGSGWTGNGAVDTPFVLRNIVNNSLAFRLAFFAGTPSSGGPVDFTEALSITNSGKVFIGGFNTMAPPSAQLTVTGMIETTGVDGGIKFPDGSVQTSAQSIIRSISAGDGLTGGGTLGVGTDGNVTLSVATGGIKSPMLAEGSVTNTKLGRGAVEKQNLAANSVGTDQLAEASVISSKLGPGAVEKQNMAANSVGRAQIEPGAVAGPQLSFPLALSGAAGGTPALSASNSAGTGMAGSGAVAGVAGYSAGGDGVSGSSASGDGVSGGSASGDGVSGSSASGAGVSGSSASGTGVFGQNTNATRIGNRPGVYGRGNAEDGVWAVSSGANGLFASGANIGAYVVGANTGVYGESGGGGFAMQAAGNSKQSRNKGGWVKAMFRYTAAGNSCFRGDEGSPGQTANTCAGFLRSVGQMGPGESIITFPIPVSDRFVVVTPQWGGNFGVAVTIEFPAPNQVQVRTWTFAPAVPTTASVSRLVDSAFTLVVF